MVTEIVSFLRYAVYAAMSLSTFIFDQTGTWPLVFSAISIILISRFLLGPVLGFTASGASDVVNSRRKSKE